MNKKLLILSDIWGRKNSDWTKVYTELLKTTFEIHYYDCVELGEIDTTIYQEEILHKQFINGGIEIATKNLLTLEKEKVDVLAFSVGGIIAWKAGLDTLKINNLYTISSTRLRYETEKPDCNIKCFFGEKDSFRPKENWFDKLKIDYEMAVGKGHNMYMEHEYAVRICNIIIGKTYIVE